MYVYHSINTSSNKVKKKKEAHFPDHFVLYLGNESRLQKEADETVWIFAWVFTFAWVSIIAVEMPMKLCHVVFNSRPAAFPGVKPAAGAVLQGHVSPGESVQGDRHPEEAGPSQCCQTSGGQEKPCEIRIKCSKRWKWDKRWHLADMREWNRPFSCLQMLRRVQLLLGLRIKWLFLFLSGAWWSRWRWTTHG